MTEYEWYKKRMADPTLDTTTYLKYWDIVRDIEFRNNRLYHEAMARPEPQLVSK